jgi:hypothetical protein
MKSAILRTLIADQVYRIPVYRAISKKVHLDNKIMMMMTTIVILIIYLMFLNCLLILVSISVGLARTYNSIITILQPQAKIRVCYY